MDEVKKHSISMENRERLTITDVDEVESFDDEKVIISTKHAALGANFIKVRLCTTLFCILSFSATYSSTRS